MNYVRGVGWLEQAAFPCEHVNLGVGACVAGLAITVTIVRQAIGFVPGNWRVCVLVLVEGADRLSVCARG